MWSLHKNIQYATLGVFGVGVAMTLAYALQLLRE